MSQEKLITKRKKAAASSAQADDVLTSTTSPDSEFSVGHRVSHTKFGEGEVVSVRDDKLTIEFVRVGKKEVVDWYVKHKR